MVKTDWTLRDTVKPDDFNDIGREINQFKDRLDNADTSPITLQPGLQVIQAERDARLRLDQIEGKTEINGLGRIGLIGVESPYVINTSGNLLPPFYEWTGRYSFQVKEPYTASSGSINGQVIYIDIPVVSGVHYTLGFDSLKCKYVAVHDNSSTIPIEEMYLVKVERATSDDSQCHFQFVGPSTGTVRVHIYGYDLQAEIDGVDRQTLPAYELRAMGPTLTRGAEFSSSKNQHRSMLAFQTELHANPTDGSNPDILFEQDGEYRKLAKWKKVVLDGAWAWESHDQASGYKVARITGGKVSGFADSSPVNKFVTKYNGVSLPWIDQAADEGAFWNDLNFMGGSFLVVIMNTDSGWGDDYTPTQDEIKAYFNGWRMCDGNTTDLYTVATGQVKCWGPIANPQNFINSTGWIDFVFGNVPTSKAPASSYIGVVYEYHPYNLLYRLAKETVEPVVTEGSLLLSEGDNMIEVGTGIVLRESIRPTSNGESPSPYYVINQPTHGSALSNKTNQILDVYQANRLDRGWAIRSNQGIWTYGGGDAVRLVSSVDISDKSYAVTYIKLDKSPVVPITGTLAVNEKAQISDLTAGVTEALQRVSVVEQKKAEKDAPAPEWITPTLLNGWAAQNLIGYMIKDGIVYIRGGATGGAIGNPMFYLPNGYRPSTGRIFAVSSRTAGSDSYVHSRVIIGVDGAVTLGVGGNNFVSFDGIIFLAEQ